MDVTVIFNDIKIYFVEFLNLPVGQWALFDRFESGAK